MEWARGELGHREWAHKHRAHTYGIDGRPLDAVYFGFGYFEIVESKGVSGSRQMPKVLERWSVRFGW